MWGDMGRCREVAFSTGSRRSRRCGRRTTPTPTPSPNPNPNDSPNPNPNQVWAPYYTLHKLLAGLLQQYVLAGNLRALEIAEGLARYIGEG